MSNNDLPLASLCNHAILNDALVSEIVEQFRTDTLGGFQIKYGQANPEREIRLGVNLARLLETCRHVPRLAKHESEVRDFLTSTLNSRETPPPWNIFSTGGISAQIYSTSKMLQGIGNEGLSMLDSSRHQEAIEFLETQLLQHTVTLEHTHPFLTVLAAQALDECAMLSVELKERVGVWADRLLYIFEAMSHREASLPFSVIYSVLLLGAVLQFLPDAVDRGRLSDLIQLMIHRFRVLPAEARMSIIRLEALAVGCSSLDALIYLLKSDRAKRELLQYPDYFVEVLNWLQDHSVLLDNGVRLFETDIFVEERPLELWYNCSAIHFLHSLSAAVRFYERERILRVLQASIPADAFSWEQLKVGGYNWPAILQNRLLDPAKNLGSHDGRPKQNGIILFGPPGTTKTSIAESIAKYLGNWPLVTLGPAQFLLSGPNQLFARIEEVFSHLIRLPRAVILFDELELLVLERSPSEPLSDWTTSLVTDVMLPWFKRLHEWGQNVYIIATNNIERIDAAIRRPNRFDFVLPVGPPSLSERERLLSNLLSNEFDYKHLATVIDDRATIGEISQWATEVSAVGSSQDEAIDLWKSVFADKLQITEDAYGNFKKNVAKYTFPPSIE